MDKKVVIITGASTGMGKAHALALLKKGHIVYGLARNINKMHYLIEAGAHAIAMDITNDEQVTAAVEQIKTEQGRVDVLINNAGFAVYGAVEEVPLELARLQFDVNLFGLSNLTQKIIPLMREKRSGRIINISSMGGKMYTPLGAWYHATKHALEGWSDCLRLELKPHGIDVVIVEPGGIDTEFTNVFEQFFQGDAENGPYARMMQTIATSTKAMVEQGKLSDPGVITNLIMDVVHSNKPKTRYVAGAFAKPLMFLRKHLSDRMFDKIVMSTVKS